MSEYRDWHVGMEVVYVGATGIKRIGGEVPEINRIYKLTAVELIHAGKVCRTPDGAAVVVPKDTVYVQIGTRLLYLARAFRPVQPRKTSIEVFTALLNTSPKHLETVE